MTILVHGSPLSQPTRAVVWTLTALGIPYTFKKINGPAGEHMTPEYVKLNPNKKFPVYQDTSQDFVLFESHAIIRYIARLKGSSSLYPVEDIKACAKIDSWLDWKHTYLREGAATVVRRRVTYLNFKNKANHSMFQTFEEVDPKREVRLLNTSLDILNDALKSSEGGFIVGNRPTIADIALATEVDQLRLLEARGDYEFTLDGRWDAVKSWLTRVTSSVPGYKETHEPLEKTIAEFKSEILQSKI